MLRGERKDSEIKKHEYDEGAVPAAMPRPEDQPQQNAEFVTPARLEEVEADLEQRNR